jgi:hypothetical protein
MLKIKEETLTKKILNLEDEKTTLQDKLLADIKKLNSDLGLAKDSYNDLLKYMPPADNASLNIIDKIVKNAVDTHYNTARKLVLQQASERQPEVIR